LDNALENIISFTESFTFVIMLCAVITLVKRKKQRPRFGKVRRYFAILLPSPSMRQEDFSFYASQYSVFMVPIAYSTRLGLLKDY